MTDSDFVERLTERGDRPGVWLPDDFEERWEALPLQDRWKAIAYWRKRNVEGTLGWRQRRRIRKVVFGGEPITECAGAEGNLQSINQQYRTEAEVRRRVQKYGKDGEKHIQELANMLLNKRWNMPEEKAFVWAEREHCREHGKFR